LAALASAIPAIAAQINSIVFTVRTPSNEFGHNIIIACAAAPSDSLLALRLVAGILHLAPLRPRWRFRLVEMPHENASTAQFEKSLSRDRETLEGEINSLQLAPRSAAPPKRIEAVVGPKQAGSAFLRGVQP
jgi:hypothetical protein